MPRRQSFWLLCCCFAVSAHVLAEEPDGSTSTEWRNDEANVVIAREVNRAYARLPFSHEYEGVLDDCPHRVSWSVGPNLPVAWKGGVAGIIGDRVALVGGLWMPGRKNLGYAFDLKMRTYEEIPPPPFETAYTQGCCDGRYLYVIGGRSAGRNVARLSRGADRHWIWEGLPALPESEGNGRWLAVAEVIPGKWLLLLAGHPTGTQSESRNEPALADWRLRLDRPDAQWEPMAPYPGGQRALVCGAVARDRLYVFGGSHPDAEMREIFVKLIQEYGLSIAPYGGVPQYRDAYSYDPDDDRWQKLRNLPFPMSGGSGIVQNDRYIYIMGETETKSHRVGKSRPAGLAKLVGGGQNSSETEPRWTGYGDLALCYDIERDNYSRLGVMLYGVATCPWVNDGRTLYGFGGEPYHAFNDNTENVLQIGVLEPAIP